MRISLGITFKLAVIGVGIISSTHSFAEFKFIGSDHKRNERAADGTKLSGHVDAVATQDLLSQEKGDIGAKAGIEFKDCGPHGKDLCVSGGAAAGKVGDQLIGGFKLRIHGADYTGPQDAPVAWAPDMETGAIMTPQNSVIDIMTLGARRIDPNGYVAFQISPTSAIINKSDPEHLGSMATARIKTERYVLNGRILIEGSLEAGIIYFIAPDANHTFTNPDGSEVTQKTRAYPGYYLSSQAGARIYVVEVPKVGKLYFGLKTKYEGMGHGEAAISDSDGTPKAIPSPLPPVQTQQLSGGISVGFGASEGADSIF